MQANIQYITWLQLSFTAKIMKQYQSLDSPERRKLRLEAAQADPSGRLVAVVHGVSKSYGGRAIVRNFSTRIMRGDRVGIVGPNGAGKTTLLNLLTGALMP